MKNTYVPKTLSEYLGESKSITLKRKYGERPTVTAGTFAPLRNRVLSYVAESGTISKRELKQFIIGLKEGGSTPAAASMFLKRNAKYFLTESRNGITYFKLSNLGQRLVNQFATKQEINVSESAEEHPLRKIKYVRESSDDEMGIPDGDEDFDEDEDEDDDLPGDDEIEAGDVDMEGPADEVDFDDDRFDDEGEDEPQEKHASTDEFEYEEDDEKITLTYYKDKGEDMEDEDLENEDIDDEDIDDEGPEGPEDEEGLPERPEDEEPREYDFKDKGRPGLLGMEESAKVSKAQFVSHKLAGKKSPNLGGKLDKKLHNLLADNQDKDDNELKESMKNKMKKIIENLKEKDNINEVKEISEEELMSAEEFEKFIKESIQLNDRKLAVSKIKELFEMHPAMNYEIGEIEGRDRYKRGLDMFKEYYLNESTKSINEAEEPDEKDELSDEDLKDIGTEDTGEETGEENVEDEKATTLDDEEEKVEITEFIITVDNVEEAIEELQELGVTAERVPVEPKEEEVPAEIEEPEESPAEEQPEEVPAEEQKVKESLSEEEKPADDIDLGSSDELGLGDQGEDALELDDKPEGEEETVEPTTDFEQNKIKVSAEDFKPLKQWLESKGVNMAEMFGGEIVEEEVDDEEEISSPDEISDEEIDFSGVSDDEEKLDSSKENKKE